MYVLEKPWRGFRLGFHRDGACWAHAHASLAIRAFIFFHFRLAIDHLDGLCGAGRNAIFTTFALIFINDCRHNQRLLSSKSRWLSWAIGALCARDFSHFCPCAPAFCHFFLHRPPSPWILHIQPCAALLLHLLMVDLSGAWRDKGSAPKTEGPHAIARRRFRRRLFAFAPRLQPYLNPKPGAVQ